MTDAPNLRPRPAPEGPRSVQYYIDERPVWAGASVSWPPPASSSRGLVGAVALGGLADYLGGELLFIGEMIVFAIRGIGAGFAAAFAKIGAPSRRPSSSPSFSPISAPTPCSTSW